MEEVVDYQITNRETKYSGKFKIEEVTVKYGDKEYKTEVFDRGHSVGAIVYNTETEKYLFVEQYRAGAEGLMIEIVAGKLEEGEKTQEAIKREIVEELGYKTDKIVHITDFYLSPGGSKEVMALFYVEVSEKIGDGGGVDEHENIRVIEVDAITCNGILFMGAVSHNDGDKVINVDYRTYKLIDAKSLVACSIIESTNLINKWGRLFMEEKTKIL